MAALRPFEPDADYCVYCHAAASGPCAVCGALCCADCVEVVMGLSTARAVCRSCRARGEAPAEARLRRWFWLAGIFVLAVLLGLFLHAALR